VSRWLRGYARMVEACVLLAGFSLAQRWLPTPRWAWLLGRSGPVPPAWSGRAVPRLIHRAAHVEEARVASAIGRAALRLPWKPTCLAQAAAAQLMLTRRVLPGVVVIGLRPPAAGSRQPMEIHAWLAGRVGVLTGGPDAEGFIPATVFEVPGGPRAVTLALFPESSEGDPS
jgi:hypothetical protein